MYKVEVGAVRFGAVSSEITTKTETFCGAVWCGFEAKTAMKPNHLVRFGAVSNGFGFGSVWCILINEYATRDQNCQKQRPKCSKTAAKMQ